MKYGRYGWSHLVLSWGLGIVFLWIGLDMFRHPGTWIGFLPQDIPGGIDRQSALQLNALFDTAVGVFLILNWWQKLIAGLAMLHLISILVYNGIDALLIRDVGLLGAATALLLWPTHYRRRRFFRLFGRRGGEVEE